MAVHKTRTILVWFSNHQPTRENVQHSVNNIPLLIFRPSIRNSVPDSKIRKACRSHHFRAEVNNGFVEENAQKQLNVG